MYYVCMMNKLVDDQSLMNNNIYCLFCIENFLKKNSLKSPQPHHEISTKKYNVYVYIFPICIYCVGCLSKSSKMYALFTNLK